MRTNPTTETLNDASLVELSRNGNRDAFSRIVERYQSLICALTYSASGNLQASEDLAQVTFITAWCQLANLRQPAKLKSWLCRIARNVTVDSFRQRQRTPTANAETVDGMDISSPAPTPSDHAISKEEEAILWRSLGELPPTYREPLVLFYRQHQSVTEVADALDLSEDAVKQRLSRGRAMLTEKVTAFVEGALQQTGPGQEFLGSVLAALPLAAGTAATTGVGLGAKGTTVAKSGGLLAFLGASLAPIISIVGSIAAQWLIVRAAPTERERRAKKSAFIALWIFALAWAVVGRQALRALAQRGEWTDQTFYAAMAVFWWFYIIVIATLMVVLFRQMLAIRHDSEKAGGTPQASGTPLTLGTRAAFVGGLYLSCFAWLIDLAWRSGDQVSTGIFTGAALLLAVSHFFQVSRRTGVAAAQMAIAHVTLAWVVILTMLNCRLDVWLAARRGTDLAEIHRLLPVWVIPSLTVTLLLWIGLVLALTKPGHRS
ncbi:MAG TPA: sigma-70 family RNA polymerase sigma factor [Verrucomicrobiae bacterium]|nr:sigma-70 family RNA polymerase sigma factor [Verrucomicrobiae bacterium]